MIGSFFMGIIKIICRSELRQSLRFLRAHQASHDRSISEEIFKAYKMDRIPYKEEVAITCFSEVNNEQLMWAHYAGSYSGFCIEYDFSKSCDSAFLRGTAKVEYTNENDAMT